MSDAQRQRRRDQARDENEAWTGHTRLKPKVPVKPGSHRPTVERNRKAIEERDERARSG